MTINKLINNNKMKVYNFKTYDEFLTKFDGEIHSIVNKENGAWFCDLHENDLVKFLDKGYILGECDFYLAEEKFRYEILTEEIIINIRNL
jgi:hypothetical protein